MTHYFYSYTHWVSDDIGYYGYAHVAASTTFSNVSNFVDVTTN
jgi:hypothetical protein